MLVLVLLIAFALLIGGLAVGVLAAIDARQKRRYLRSE